MKFFLLVVCSICTINLMGQDLAASKQYFLQAFLLNPAIAGTTGCSELLFGHQQQWSGLEDAPSTQTLSYQTRIGQIGAGASLINDKNGYTQHRLAQGIFAYHVDFSRRELENTLSFGFAASVVDNSVDETKFIQHGIDPAVTGTKTDVYYPDLNFGIFYINHAFSCGAAFKQVLSQKAEGIREPNRPTYFFLQAAYNFRMDAHTNILPSLVYTSGDRWLKQLDMNCKFFYLNSSNIRYWTGISYHLDLCNTLTNKLDMQLAMGLSWNHFLLAYAYETIGYGLIENGFGSHKIMIGMNFCPSKRRKCPAYE